MDHQILNFDSCKSAFVAFCLCQSVCSRCLYLVRAHLTHEMRIIATGVPVARCVRRSIGIGLSITCLRPAKMPECIEVLFGVRETRCHEFIARRLSALVVRCGMAV